jgi:acyl-CoA thioester hydrolase
MYTTQLLVGWADIDLNGHMRNTAYLEKSVDVRMLYFTSAGFDAAEFGRLRIGPVVMTDSLRYFREVQLLAQLTCTLALAGLATDGSRFRMRNEFLNGSGVLLARVDSTGGWLDGQSRRLIAPPPAVAAALEMLGRTEDFEELPSSLRSGPRT